MVCNVNFLALETLVTSDNQQLRKVCAYAHWQIRGGHHDAEKTTPKLKEDPPSYEEAVAEPPKSAETRKGQIMISYQWDNQGTMRIIRDKLIEAGYRVWMDITHMSK